MTHFNSPAAREKEDVDFVVDFFKHKRDDTVEWLSSVKWAEKLAVVEEKVLQDTLESVLLVSPEGRQS